MSVYLLCLSAFHCGWTVPTTVGKFEEKLYGFPSCVLCLLAFHFTVVSVYLLCLSAFYCGGAGLCFEMNIKNSCMAFPFVCSMCLHFTLQL